MEYQPLSSKKIAAILSSAKRIAVVGLSDKPHRTSYQVARYMQQVGYEILPVNPNIEQTLGQEAYASLREIEGKVDIVNVFLRSEKTPAIAREAVQIGAGTLWLQLGVKHEQSFATAQRGGLQVVMDDCIKVRHEQLGRGRA